MRRSLRAAACSTVILLIVSAVPGSTTRSAPSGPAVYVDDYTGDATRGRFVMEAEHYADRSVGAGGGWWEVDENQQFVDGPDAGQAVPNPTPDARGNYMTSSAPFGTTTPPIDSSYDGSIMEYRFAVEATGVYRLFARWRGVGEFTDSIYASIWRPDGTLLSDAGPQWFTFHQWRSSWIWDDRGIEDSTFVAGVGFPDEAVWTIAEPGVYTLRISQREPESALDALVLQTNGLDAPSGVGPPESETAAVPPTTTIGGSTSTTSTTAATTTTDVVAPTTSPPTSTIAPTDVLPATGSDRVTSSVWAATALLAGWLLVVASRRRRTPTNASVTR